MGPGDDPRLLPHRSLVEADRLLGRDARGSRRARGGIPRSLPQSVRACGGGGVGTVRGRARGRLQHAGCTRGHARLARSRAPTASARHLRVGVARRGAGRPAGGRGAGEATAGGPRCPRFRRGRPSARRDRSRGLGSARRRGRLPARSPMTREQVYGRRPLREALRGPREVLELWATERAVKTEPWLQEVERPRLQVKPERELSDAAGTRDHQGMLAWCEPYKYADGWELAAADRPLLACLDQVTDPRNLGAVCRSAEGAGATGVVVPAHGSATVTPAVARASAGAVEHLPVAVVPNLARYLGEVKSGDLWIYAAAGDAERSMWETDLSGGVAL